MAATNELAWGGLTISFQRCGRGAWSARTLLRSWGAAPCKRVGDAACAVACCDDEVVWLGLAANDGAVDFAIASRSGRWQRALTAPPDWQVGWLEHGSKTQPLAWRRGSDISHYTLTQRRAGHGDERLDLMLMSPRRWRRDIGALRIAVALQPPPVERYSRMISLDEDL